MSTDSTVIRSRNCIGVTYFRQNLIEQTLRKSFSDRYTQLSLMKANRIFVRALLLISLLCPLSLRASGSSASSPSCRVPKHSIQQGSSRRAAKSSPGAVLTASIQRPPAQRLHRHRGKRVHLDSALALAPTRKTIAEAPVSAIALHAQTYIGPNPPRGPPAPSI